MTYNIFNEKEMNETISVSECRNLRRVMSTLTAAPMITKREYVRFMTVVDGILKRMESEVGENETD